MKKLISLIIPCYNEEEGLNILHSALDDVAKKMEEYDFDTINDKNSEILITSFFLPLRLFDLRQLLR